MPPDELGPYFEEIPAGVRTIQPVPTSVAAFVGYTEKGPVHQAVRIRSLADFEREFGSISASDTAAAAAHFFINGGSTAWVVRVGGTAVESNPSPDELIGSEVDGTGMYALDGVDSFNLLLIPSASTQAAHRAMTGYSEQRRAFAILDMPVSVATLSQAQSWIAGAPKSANAAAYFPRLVFADPANPGQRRAFPNSGGIAGLFARTDAQRGVWTAPAGLGASIRNAVSLEIPLTDRESGLLNPLGMNALRTFPGAGVVAWGARTLVGADSLASQWKYVAVRRTALMLEESISRGLRWTTFEPNDEPLWAQIRLNVGAFMQSLFVQGAFQGASPREAYFIHCDATTTTAAGVASGVVNLSVGFAPLRPAEFVVLSFSHLAGQSE
jgi:phage tail sheath protein FI